MVKREEGLAEGVRDEPDFLGWGVVETERCFGEYDEERAENCSAVCSPVGESSEGGLEEGYTGLSEVAVCGC